MILRNLTLRDLGCFPEASFEFAPLTVVQGENRSGKSTLVHALFFALFGEHLHRNLAPADLIRKGRYVAEARLTFRTEGGDHRLTQRTDRLPGLERREETTGEWGALEAVHPEELRSLLPLSPETAALTAFFRESELIYFLQDVPRYNQTLLENLTGMDDALIVRSRFKKALGRAREYRKAVERAAPRNPVAPLDEELARRRLTEAESVYERVDAAYRAIRRDRGPDPSLLQMLRRQHAEKTRERERLEGLLRDLPRPDALEGERAELESTRAEMERTLSEGDDLQQALGRWSQKAEQVGALAAKLRNLQGASHCPVCRQSLSSERVGSLVRETETEAERAETHRRELAARLTIRRKQTNRRAELERRLADIVRRLEEVRSLERRIAELGEQIAGLESDLVPFRSENDDADRKRQTLLEQREQVQREMIDHRVTLKRAEDQQRRAEENRRHLEEADRRILLCKVAHEAVDSAIGDVGAHLLARIRESVTAWSSHFSYLDRFDVKMTDRELLPVIQARGYQYKLGQMSKSERIFLYLMLKLAIGDALGHLGLLILDDPADGLDAARKRTLAYLLTEVARRRQVIVTTNDVEFAGLFENASRIDLLAE
ncbi:MAG: ATP-binding protein [Desulfococcaceae bacterium]